MKLLRAIFFSLFLLVFFLCIAPNAHAATTSAKYAGTAASVNPGGGNCAWSPASNATGDTTSTSADCSHTGNGSVTNQLVLTNFGFTASDVPSTATIVGIQVEVEWNATQTSIVDNSVNLTVDGSATVGTNKAAGTNQTTKAIQSYGGAADTWSAGITAAQAVSTNFGVILTYLKNASGAGSADSVYRVRITITYNTSPTVALNTPTNASTTSDTTPTLNFTGTDVDSDTLEYNVQVDTVNTFNSSVSTIASNSESTVDSSIDIYFGTPGNNGGGQTFTTSSSVPLTSVKFYLKKSGSPIGNVPVALQATSGGLPTGSVLATSNNLDISTLTTSYQLIEFTFSSPYTLSASTMYSLTLTPPGTTNSTDKIILGVDASSPGYSGGTTLTYLATDIITHASDSGFYAYTTGPLLDKFSTTDTGFTAGHPFASGVAKDFTVQAGDALSAGTYYWRVAAIDPSGSNTYGAWSSTYSFTITAAVLDHYLVTVASPQTAGVCVTGTNTVTAQDVSNATVTSDASTVNMTSSGTGVTFYTTNGCSSSTTTYTLSSGVSNIYYKTNKAQSFTITATKASSTETGTSSSITVDPGSHTRLVITLPSQTFTAGSGNSGSVTAQTANSAFNITSITATDDYFNIITGYTGAKTLAYAGPAGSPTYTTSVSFTSGQSTTTLATTLPTAETTTITATDGGLYGYASSSLTVNGTGGQSEIRGGVEFRGGSTIR